MPNDTHQWVKVAENGCKSPQRLSWIRGDSSYHNMNHMSAIFIKEFQDNSYCNGEVRFGNRWQVFGRYMCEEPFLIKSYKKKESAYRWLGMIMGENK